jgi:GTP cyclohydrolase I
MSRDQNPAIDGGDTAESANKSAETDPEQIQRIAAHVRAILVELGLDMTDHNLQDTDVRVAKMYDEMFHGLKEGAEPAVTTFPNEEEYSHMVMERDIPFYRIIGLSKFARILEFYAKRPQLQERLTEQVVGFLEEKLHPLGAMVVIEARHLCVEMRGVKKPGALTVTSAIRGAFHQRPVREEFLDLLRRS